MRIVSLLHRTKLKCGCICQRQRAGLSCKLAKGQEWEVKADKLSASTSRSRAEANQRPHGRCQQCSCTLHFAFTDFCWFVSMFDTALPHLFKSKQKRKKTKTLLKTPERKLKWDLVWEAKTSISGDDNPHSNQMGFSPDIYCLQRTDHLGEQKQTLS